MLLLAAVLIPRAADTFHTPRRREPSTQRETAWGVTYLDGAGPRRVEHNLKPLPPCLALATGKQRIPLWCVMYHDGTGSRRVKHNRSVTPAPRARIWNGADRDLRSQLVSSLRVFAGALQARRSIRIENRVLKHWQSEEKPTAYELCLDRFQRETPTSKLFTQWLDA